MSFYQQLQQAWTQQQSLLTVGLDPDPSKFPRDLHNKPEKIIDFCRNIVDSTANFCSSFKPQIAYFAANRAEDQLEELCLYIKKNHPNHVLILDAKRGDIGSTAEQYAREAFERYRADAVTVNPYMGYDSIAPYLEHQDKGIIVLCRTSNPGGSDLQFLTTDTQEPLFLRVAQMVAEKWNTHQQCGLVVGATFPNELSQVRQVVGDDIPLLIPGIGAQGGDIIATVQAGKNKHNTGMMISSSRAIIYASQADDWGCAARRAAHKTNDEIQQALGC